MRSAWFWLLALLGGPLLLFFVGELLGRSSVSPATAWVLGVLAVVAPAGAYWLWLRAREQ